eukprot:scaffold53978_cov63-Phaeocystis_antarctica.AAC.5
MKRGRPRDEMRDLDLHPDHMNDDAADEDEAADGMLQRAKRHASSSLESLSSSLEEPSGKLRRLRTTAETLRTRAEARYETAPSARELRAATREVVRDNVSIAAGATASEVRLLVRAANEELDLMADEVAEVARKADLVARKAAHRTAQAASAVQAQAASAVQGIQAHGEALTLTLTLTLIAILTLTLTLYRRTALQWSSWRRRASKRARSRRLRRCAPACGVR